MPKSDRLLGTPFTTANGGTLTLNSDGSYDYTPPAQGSVPAGGVTETFNYTITDSNGDSSSTTLTIEVANNPQPGTISGTVTSSDDNSGIEGVTISLLNLDETPVTDGNGIPIVAKTQSDGSYQFTNVPPGDYKVKETNLPNYIDNSDSDGDNPNIIRVTITDGTNATSNNFVDIPRSTISGSVSSDNNSPLSGVVVELYDSTGTNSITATTGINGLYKFTNVKPGDYTAAQSRLS